MKKTKQILAMILAVMLVAALSVSSFAANDGSITISNTKVGQTYAVYKMFDLTYSGTNVAYTYTTNGTEANPDALLAAFNSDSSPFTLVETEVANVYNVYLKEGKTAQDVGTFADAMKDAGKLGTAIATEDGTAGDLVFDSLPYGYYFITSSLGTVVTVDSTLKDVTVIDKNTTQEIAKWIIEGDKKVKVNDVNVGDTVTYQVEVPLYQYDGTKKITEYYVFDEMHDGLTYNGDLAATLNGNAFTAYTVAEKTTSDPYAFRVAVPIQDVGEDGKYNGTFLYDNNAVVIFTYTVTVNEEIVVDDAMDNTATLDWDTNKKTPDEKEIPFEPTPDRPYDETESYSVELKVCKVDENGSALTGAKFSISGLSSNIIITNKEIYVKDSAGEYWRLKDGLYTKNAPVEGDDPNTEEKELPNTDLYESTKQKYSKVETIDNTTKETTVEAEGWVNTEDTNKGIMTFTGLGASGDNGYSITELVAPNGYNLLTDPVKVVVVFNEGDDDTAPSFSATIDGKAATVVDGVITIEVVNNAGTVLPSTGGIGTTIFYIAGAVLAVGAAIVLFAKKRVSED